MTQRMDADRTKLAARAALVGYRSAKKTAELVGGLRGQEIKQGARARTREILDGIEQEGTDADEEKALIRRELEADAPKAFQIEDEASRVRH